MGLDNSRPSSDRKRKAMAASVWVIVDFVEVKTLAQIHILAGQT